VNTTTSRALYEIGEQLDHHVFPRVGDGGIVMPSEAVVQSTPGEDRHHEQQRKQRRPEAGSRQRSAGGQRPSGGSRKAREAASNLQSSLEAHHKDELTAVARAYPKTIAWRRESGLWLLTESALLSGLSRTAVFLVWIPYAPAMPHAWGFWRHSVAGVTWIGPRHTKLTRGLHMCFSSRGRDMGCWRLAHLPSGPVHAVGGAAFVPGSV